MTKVIYTSFMLVLVLQILRLLAEGNSRPLLSLRNYFVAKKTHFFDPFKMGNFEMGILLYGLLFLCLMMERRL